MSLLVYPNQLFEKKFIPKNIHTLIIYEHPNFFTKYEFNKLKLLLHRESMKQYETIMKKYYHVVYVNFNEKIDKYTNTELFMFYQPNQMKTYGNIISSPNFLCYELFEEYRNKTDKFTFSNFYMWMKTKLNILPDIKSTDKYNRNKIPNGLNIPKDKYFYYDNVDYIIKYFSDNPGPDLKIVDILFPCNHRQAKSLLKHFISTKLENFGKYQDALIFKDDKHTLFHSCLSSSINIGLLNPIYVIESILESDLNINSVEAFIRQLFWREYQLYCYTYMKIKPVYSTPHKLTPEWINGSIGVEPVDHTIKKAFNIGYLHHIERLMIMGNFMLLYGLDSKSAFKWFMEFSIDSYEWVMYQNVYDMVYGMGSSMSRIYISSSNYILKMSDLKRGDWCTQFDNLYHKFLKTNKGNIGYPYEF